MASGRKDAYKDAVPFKKGYDSRRNYNGRPKKTTTEIMNELSDVKTLTYSIELTDTNGNKRKKTGRVKTRKTIKEMIAVQLLQKAVSGDLKAIREFLDRTEGKPKQQIDLETVEEIKVGFSDGDEEIE
jgi:hypothetical protein